MSQDVRPEAPTAHVATARRGVTPDGPGSVPSPAAAPDAEYGPPGRYAPTGAGEPARHGVPAGYGYGGPAGFPVPPVAGPPVPGQAGPGYAPPAGYGAPAPAPQTEGTAIGALVCGFLVAPVGVVLGIVALRRIKRRGTRGKGLAIGGIVVGALSTLAVLASTLFFVALVSGGGVPSSTTSCGNGVCETTVHGTPISIDDIGGENGQRFVVVSVGSGSAQVQGETDAAPTTIPAGETFTVGDQPVMLVSTTDGTAVFRYNK